MAADKLRLPVNLLTGFLGSGKTTLLNRLLAQAEMADTLVIINEFGSVGLDHLLVAHQTETATVLELSNGCLCCQLRTDLRQTLKDVAWRFSRQGKRQFRRIIIETSGLADPVPILHTLMQDPYLAALYQLDTIATVVDAQLGQATLSRHVEARKQVALADVLLISKAELWTGQHEGACQLQALRQSLATLNPLAKVEVLAQGMDLAHLFANAGEAQDFPHWLQALAQIEAQGLPAELSHGSEHTSLSLELPSPLTRAQFDHWLAALRAYGDPGLLRYKGIFHLQQANTPLALHRVQHVMHDPQPVAAWEGDQVSRMVFIMQDTAPASLGTLLQALPR